MIVDYLPRKLDIRTVIRLQSLLTETIKMSKNVTELHTEFVSMGLVAPDNDIKAAVAAIGNLQEKLYKAFEIKIVESQTKEKKDV